MFNETTFRIKKRYIQSHAMCSSNKSMNTHNQLKELGEMVLFTQKLSLFRNHQQHSLKPIIIINTTIFSQSPFSYSSVSTLANLFSKQTTAAAATKLNNAEIQDKPPLSSTTNKGRRAQIMAGLINTKPWSAYLESSLSSLCPLSLTTTLNTLRLMRTPSKALHFFNWAEESGFVHTQQSYTLMLQILCKARNLNPARNFLFSIPKRSNGAVQLDAKHFNVLILGYGNAGLFQESLKVYKTMKAIGVSPSVVTFNELFLMLLRRGRTGIVYELYDEMLKTYGVKPDLYSFNILIRGFCKNKMVDEGFRFFKEMESLNCEADLVTYNTIVDRLCRVGKVEIARNVMKGMLRKDLNLTPNVVTYTTLIRGYCGKLEIDEALDVYQDMVSRGVKPNEITYNTLVQGLCEAQKFDKVKEILEESGGFKPDTCTFNTLMNAQCSVGNLEEAIKIFENMSRLKVQPDSASYSVLIRNLCQCGDFGRAEELFDELSDKEILLREEGCTPLVAAYNPMFDYLCKNGKTEKAERVFRQLMRRGTQDAPAFKTLIMGHCKEGSSEAGHELLRLMLRRKFKPDLETYECLIDGLLQKGMPVLAHDTLEKMLNSSYLPKTSTFHQILTELVKKGCARESASLVMLMLEKKVRPTISLSTDTVSVLFKSDLKVKGFEIVKCLYEKGYMVNMGELIKCLCKGRKIIEAYELLLFSLKKEEKVDFGIYDKVLTGLCKVRKVSEAFKLYYELLEHGVKQPFGCLEDLRNGLHAEGKLNEADFVAKRMPNQVQT